MVIQIAESVPPDIEGLYQFIIQRIGRAHGHAWVYAFSWIISLSSKGLREIDFHTILPSVAQIFNPSIDPDHDATLKFASLRRAFATLLIKRGSPTFIDFSSRIFKHSVIFGDHQTEIGQIEYINRIYFDYVKSLPPGDDFRSFEFLHKAFGCGAYKEIAYYLASDLTKKEIYDAMVTLEQTLNSLYQQQNDLELIETILAEVALLDQEQRKRVFTLLTVTFRQHLRNKGENLISIRFLETVIDHLLVNNRVNKNIDIAILLVNAACDGCKELIATWDTSHSLAMIDRANSLYSYLCSQQESQLPSLDMVALKCDLNVTQALLCRLNGDAKGARQNATAALSALEEIQNEDVETIPLSIFNGELLMRIGDAISIADPELAGQLYSRAITSLENIVTRRHESMVDLGTLLQRYGSWLVKNQQPESAIKVLQRGQNIFDDLVESNPNHFLIARNLAVISLELANAYFQLSEFENADVVINRALRIVERLVNEVPTDINNKRLLAQTLWQLTQCSAQQLNIERTFEISHRAVEVATSLRRYGDPDESEFQIIQQVSASLLFLSDHTDRSSTAISCMDKVREICNLWIQSIPKNLDTIEGLMKIWLLLSAQYRKIEANDIALAVLDTAISTGVAFRETHSANDILAENLCEIHKAAGGYRLDVSDFSGALWHCGRGLEEAILLQKGDSTNPSFLRNLVMCWNNMSAVQNRTGNVHNALAANMACENVIAKMHAANMTLDEEVIKIEKNCKFLQSRLISTGMQHMLEQAELNSDPDVYLQQVKEQLSNPDDIFNQQFDIPKTTEYPIEPEVSIPIPHPAADPKEASRLNAEYQQELRRWKALTWLNRMRMKKPEPPTGI